MAKARRLTQKDLDAIDRLRRALKALPDKFWIFAADSKLHVMWLGPDGSPIMAPGLGGGVDQDYIADTLDGPYIDGGDW